MTRKLLFLVWAAVFWVAMFATSGGSQVDAYLAGTVIGFVGVVIAAWPLFMAGMRDD